MTGPHQKWMNEPGAMAQFGGKMDLHLNLDGGKQLITQKNRMKM